LRVPVAEPKVFSASKAIRARVRVSSSRPPHSQWRLEGIKQAPTHHRPVFNSSSYGPEDTEGKVDTYLPVDARRDQGIVLLEPRAREAMRRDHKIMHEKDAVAAQQIRSGLEATSKSKAAVDKSDVDAGFT